MKTAVHIRLYQTLCFVGYSWYQPDNKFFGIPKGQTICFWASKSYGSAKKIRLDNTEGKMEKDGAIGNNSTELAFG